MQDLKNKIEAVLFTVGRFVSLDELSKLTGIASKGSLSEALGSLNEDYKKHDANISQNIEKSIKGSDIIIKIQKPDLGIINKMKTGTILMGL